MAVNTTQGIVLAIFGANAGGHLSSLDANATANGNASLATDLSASAGLILGVDLSSDAVFTSTVLGNLGIAEDSAGYTLASNYFTTNLAAGAGRGDLVAAAVEYLLGSSVDASLADTATAFSASVTAGVEYSQGAGATVFGVSALRAAAGSPAGGSGSSFELTTGDDNPQMTAGDDVVTGTSATLSTDDRIADASSTDGDVLNLVLNRDVTDMDVSNVESINIDWDGFGTPDIGLDSVSGATVTVTSDKAGYLGHLNVTALGENALVAGAGVTGDVDVEAAEDTTITATAAETIDIGGTTNSDGDITINAGVATDVTMIGGDNVTLNGDAADDISLTGGGDSATLNLGVDADVTFTGAADGVLNVNSAADITVTIEDASVLETVSVGGEGAVTLSFENVADLSGSTVTGAAGIEVTDDNALAAAMDFTAVAVDQAITLDAVAPGGTAVAADVLTGASFILAADINENATFQTSDDDTSSDSINLTLQAVQTDDLIFDAADEEIESVNITIDPAATFDTDSAFTIGDLQGNSGDDIVFTLTSTNADVDVTITAADASEIDASAVAGNFELTAQTTDETITVIGSATGDNTISDIKAGTLATTQGTYIGGAGDDDVTFTSILGEISAVVGAGDNTVLANGLTSGTLYVEATDGDDTVEIDGITTGDVTLALGDGDNTVRIGATGNVAAAEIIVNAGAGDDTVEFEGATVAGTVITMNLGTGDNVLDATNGVDITAGTQSITGLTEIAYDGAFSANVSDMTINSDLLDGSTIRITGDGDVTDIAQVEIDTNGTIDFSGVVVDNTISKAIGGLEITAMDATGDYTIIGTDGIDTFTMGTSTGDNTITGGEGADTITLDTTDGEDVVIVGAGDSTATVTLGTGGTAAQGSFSGIDVVANFELAGVDTVDLEGTPTLAAVTTGTDGTDSTAAYSGGSATDTIKSHAIDASGMVTFDDADTYAAALAEGTDAFEAAAAIQYLLNNDIGNAGATVGFQMDSNTYIYQQTATTAGGTGGAVVVELTGVNGTSLLLSGTTAGGVLIA